MNQYDPKLIKKVNGTKLIAMAKEVGIKNAEKVSKEQLIPAYLEAVEKLDQTTLTAPVVELYNELVTILGLDQTPGEEAAPETEEAEAEAQPEAPTPAPAPTPTLAPRLAPRMAPTVAKPVPAAAAPKAEKAPKPEKKAPLPPKDTYSRWMALGDTFKELAEGKLEDLVNRSNEVYKEHGGKDNISEAKAIAKASLVLLKSMGLATVTGDTYKLV
jgi:uncharacterized protein YnzC (UPF0291/DUF896 family)